jgi:kumamolisin
MQRSVVHKLVLAIIAVLVVGGGAFSLTLIARAKQDTRVPISGQTVPLLRNAHLLGATGGQQQLAISVGLQLRNQQELNMLLKEQQNRHSSLYHRYLTPQQFAAEFGPTAAQQQQVVDYLRGQGMSVTHVSSNGLLIDATATVAQAQAAFTVQINNYQSGARHFYANASAPSVPNTISTLITSIGGLDNSQQMRPLSHLLTGKAQRVVQSHTSKRTLAGSGYGPTDLLGAYDGTTLQQSGVKGNNQTVAVFELDGYQQSDIQQYLQTYSLGSPSISNVLVDGFNGSAGQGAIEVELDIEVVAAMAPSASQVVYEGPNSTQGVNDTYNKIVTDNKAQITTISWGECESQTGASELQTLDGIFKQGAAQGISMFSAAGDSGAYDCNDTNLAVDSPASDPNIIGVGGTNLQTGNGAYGSESVWSNPSDTQRSPKGSGGGGGISSTFAQPSWQTGPGVKNQYSNGNREVPDVSADADPQTGYAVYCTVSAAGCTGNTVVGGTSAAAPLWAGSMAMINNYLQTQNKPGVGFVTPQLYSLANSQQQYAPFHDVTSGNNLYYPATAGYDEASGVGSPDIYNIARDLAGGTAPTPSPTATVPTTPTPAPTVTDTPTAVPTNTPTSVPTDTPTTTSTPQTPVPTSTSSTGSSLVQNGGFENGTDPWQESSTSGYELIDSTHPHTGQYSAHLCGYVACDDTIAQDFTVPTSASNISVGYWVNVQSDRTSSSCVDTLTISILDSNGQEIGMLHQSCNTNSSNTWKQEQSDVTSLLSQYAGQTVTLIFTGNTSYTGNGNATTFFVDDVSVMAR